MGQYYHIQGLADSMGDQVWMPVFIYKQQPLFSSTKRQNYDDLFTDLN